MAISRKATAVWHGTGLEGTGTLNTPNHFFTNTPYSFKTRFEPAAGVPGTNPEELLAAAHASCFAMALSFAVAQAGFVADELRVEAQVTLDTVAGGPSITGIILQLAGRVAGMDEAQFLALANGAKAGCPISKALSAVPIHLDATFAA